MSLLEVLGRVGALLLLRADAGVAEMLLSGAVAVLVVTLLAVLAALPPAVPTHGPVAARFAAVRPRLRASDPAAAGHVRARAPGAVR